MGNFTMGYPVALLPGEYRIEVADRIWFWTGKGTFEIPSDDGSGTELEIAVALAPR